MTIQIPDEHLKEHYRPVKNPIVDAFQYCLDLNQPSYLLLQYSRGVGKSYSVSNIIVKLMERNPEFHCLSIMNSRKNVEEVLKNSGYMRDHGVTPENGWHKEEDGWVYTPTGSRWIFGTIKDKKALEQKRGLHRIKFIYQEEAQEVTNYQEWMNVFSKIGKVYNSIKVLVTTGSKYPESLSQHVEALLETKAIPGIMLRKTIYDFYKEDPCEFWKAQIEEEEKLALKPMSVEGDIVNKYQKPTDNPDFMREIMCEHIEGSSISELAFPQFRQSDVSFDPYEIDFNRPLIQFADYGSFDPYGCLFAQVKGHTVHIFSEIFNKQKVTRNMSTFAYDLAVKLEELKLAKIEMETSTSQTGLEQTYQKFNTTFLHPLIYFGGDDHGRANWNHYLSVYFNTTFVGPVDRAEHGLDLIRQFIETKQLVIHSTCPQLVNDLATVTTMPMPNKFAISIDHKKSTLIVALSYILQALVNDGMLPIVRPEEKIKEEVKEVKKESFQYDVPFSLTRSHNQVLKDYLGRI